MIRTSMIAAAALATSACQFGARAENKDPGPASERSYNVAAFDRIEVAGPYEVTVRTGGKTGVSATGGQNLLDETEVLVDGSTLRIQPRKRKGFRWSWGNNSKAKFTVTTAMLRGAAIAGSGGIAVDRIEGDFTGEVAGSGDLKLAAVKGGAVEFSIAGSGDVSAAGTAASTKIEIAGSGDVDAAGLAAKTASVSIAGSGNVRANASDTAEVEIVGSGDVELTGGAKCTVSKVGSGNVRCS